MTIGLQHNEVPARLNIETGEVKTIPAPRGKPDSEMSPFDLQPSYTRICSVTWRALETMVSEKELMVAYRLAIMAKAFTGSLQPLNDETTAITLAETLKTDRSLILKYIDKLFRLGVIGKFEVYERDAEHKKYWVFNPYLAFNGNKIRRDIVTLFDKTTFAYIARGSSN